jgi:hypothetical protein
MGIQSEMKAGRVLAKRRGIYGGPMNLRRRGTACKLREWIKHYRKEVDEGRFCPKRGAKIIAHFEKLLEKSNHDDN